MEILFFFLRSWPIGFSTLYRNRLIKQQNFILHKIEIIQYNIIQTDWVRERVRVCCIRYWWIVKCPLSSITFDFFDIIILYSFRKLFDTNSIHTLRMISKFGFRHTKNKPCKINWVPCVKWSKMILSKHVHPWTKWNRVKLSWTNLNRSKNGNV